MNEHYITVNIYWNDLEEGIQQKLLRIFGDEHNWDAIPLASVVINNSGFDDSNFVGKDIVVDSFLGDEGF